MECDEEWTKLFQDADRLGMKDIDVSDRERRSFLVTNKKYHKYLMSESYYLSVFVPILQQWHPIFLSFSNVIC